MTIDWTQMVTAADKTAATQASLRARVNIERSRRISAGFTVAVTGVGNVAMHGRPEDMTNLLSLFNGAQVRKAAGDATASLVFRDGNNVNHSLTPDQMIGLYLAGATWVSSVYAAGWAMKDAATMVSNPEANEHWP